VEALFEGLSVKPFIWLMLRNLKFQAQERLPFLPVHFPALAIKIMVQHAPGALFLIYRQCSSGTAFPGRLVFAETIR
jgi:hypothetical protein